MAFAYAFLNVTSQPVGHERTALLITSIASKYIALEQQNPNSAIEYVK